jgi:hypothetical protein
MGSLIEKHIRFKTKIPPPMYPGGNIPVHEPDGELPA